MSYSKEAYEAAMKRFKQQKDSGLTIDVLENQLSAEEREMVNRPLSLQNQIPARIWLECG